MNTQAFRTLFFACAAGLLVSACSAGSQTALAPPASKVTDAVPPLTPALFAHARHVTLTPANVNITFPEELTNPDSLRKPASSVSGTDNELVGTVVNAGGPYTAMSSYQTVYSASMVNMPYPAAATAPQQIDAPVNFPPNGSCLASGTVYVNSGSGVSAYFVVFDSCHGGFKKQAVAVPIDSTFMSNYVSAPIDLHYLPVYNVWVGEWDPVPTANSTWYVSLYNRQTGNWDIVYQEKGLNGTKYGLSSYLSYLQPGPCPNGLPTLSAINVQLYTPGVGYESVAPTMTGTTSYVSRRGQCFKSDTTGPPALQLSEVTPNSYWTVTSGTPAGYAYDDWIEWAHDAQHTGYQAQSTGISTYSAPNLKLRWKITVPNGMGIYSSPLVYKGNVIVVTEQPPVSVYDLSAVDGHVIWSVRLPGAVNGTPTIDPSSGLLFVGNRVVDSLGSHPSYLYALHLSNGTQAWATQIPGITHQGPTVANGVAYIGTSGGDPPDCLNGSVSAIDTLTGAVKWTWYENSAVNPGGGGAVWGAIGFDGDRIVFGTGNASCGSTTLKLPTSNGAVALDLNGNLLWSFVAQQNSYWDYDTGGGTMISKGVAYFKNKTGILYAIDPSTGMLLRQTKVDPNFGYGEFPSPSTDGNTTVISWGLNPTPAPTAAAAAIASSVQANAVPSASMQREIEARTHANLKMIEHHTRNHPFETLNGYYSALVGINSVGTVIWTHNMNSMLDGYAAITNGVVIADEDQGLSAFDLLSGNRLWNYPFPSMPAASPVIVPSGVYAADGSGNVYAFYIPSS